jgi:delta 1-pyrroline-5-carboxylate dehydrogenase
VALSISVFAAWFSGMRSSSARTLTGSSGPRHRPVLAAPTARGFPAMIPMWKFAPALACGNAFILKPSERDPSVPMRLAELLVEAGLPAGVLTSSTATRKRSTRRSPTRA